MKLNPRTPSLLDMAGPAGVQFDTGRDYLTGALAIRAMVRIPSGKVAAAISVNPELLSDAGRAPFEAELTAKLDRCARPWAYTDRVEFPTFKFSRPVEWLCRRIDRFRR